MIGKKLRELIKSRGIKQIKLAEYLGISPSRLSNYLSDKREPDLEMLAKMARFLNIDLNHFVDAKFKAVSNVPEPVFEEEIVYIKMLMTNSKRWSNADKLPFPKSLLHRLNVDRLFIYEAHADMGNIAKQGDYLVVEAFSPESASNGDLLLFRGRNYRLATLFIKDAELMLIHTNALEKAYELDKYDIVRMVLYRL